MILGTVTKRKLPLLIAMFLLLSNIKPHTQINATPQPNPGGDQEPGEQNLTETDTEPESAVDQVSLFGLHPKILAILVVVFVLIPSVAIYTLKKNREN